MPDARNAKAEFIDEVEGKIVLCAEILYSPNDEETEYNLCTHYTPAEYDAFLQSLDFVYDAGFGGQELFGVIWYTDGTWSSRYEYDGSEEWASRRAPVVPEYLKRATQ
jgi:hypothetical protein